jgi:hypothetical protein
MPYAKLQPPALQPQPSHSRQLLTKNVTSDSALPHFCGIGPARFIAPVEMGDLPVPRLLRNPACTLAGKRFARIELLYFKRLLPGLRRLAFFVGHFSGRTTILEFFSTREVAELAKSLAQDVAKRYPPAIANSPAQVVSQQRLSDILEEVFARATEFSREHRPGWYKRIRLGKDFRWELNELGYDEKFVSRATEGLILCVSRNPSPKI